MYRIEDITKREYYPTSGYIFDYTTGTHEKYVYIFEICDNGETVKCLGQINSEEEFDDGGESVGFKCRNDQDKGYVYFPYEIEDYIDRCQNSPCELYIMSREEVLNHVVAEQI